MTSLFTKCCLAVAVVLLLISEGVPAQLLKKAAPSYSLMLEPSEATPVTGRWSINSKIKLKTLDRDDQALVIWDGVSIDARRFDYLSINMEGLPNYLDAVIVWRTDAHEEAGSLAIPRNIGGSTTVSLNRAKNWDGTVSLLGIAVDSAFGLPVAQRSALSITFDAVSLEESSWQALARAHLTAWVSPRLVRGSTINTIGPTGIPGTIPLLFVAYIVFVGLVTIGILSASRRNHGTFLLLRFSVAGLLVAHLIAILPMWRDLAVNVGDAHGTYDASREPLRATPAWHLYEIARQVKAEIPNKNAKIFVASESQFTRERINYFLAPFNSAPFFDTRYRVTRNNAPAAAGDYVVGFYDAGLEWNAETGLLRTPWHQYQASRVWANEHASLFAIGPVVK